MSEQERVTEVHVGDRWLLRGVDTTIYAEEPRFSGKRAWKTCREGAVDPKDGYKHGGADCCWEYEESFRCATLISRAIEPTQGRVPPLKGDVWRWNAHGSARGREGQEITFTGARNDWGQWLTAEGVSAFMESQFTDGRIAFLRAGTPAPVEGGEARVGDRCCEKCERPGEARKLVLGDPGLCSRCCGPTYRVIVGATPAVQPKAGKAPTFLHRARAPKTYAELMRAERESDGVAELPTCGQCGAQAVVNQMRECAACYARADKGTARAMVALQYTFKPYVAEPEPWLPSCDPDHWLPNVGERGTR